MPNQQHESWELAQYQALPLHAKIAMSKQRIKAWYEYWQGNVYVSYSGGKDSTVLLHLVRSMYPDVPAVFSDTGLEFPEIRKFAMSHESVSSVRPKMLFPDVVSTYGYPIISKEVAEAIYAARRINRGGRWARRKRPELLGKRAKEDETPRRRGRVEAQAHRHIDCAEQENGAPGQDGRVERRDGRAGVVMKSMFNKEQWYPICELPIPISHYCCYVMKKSPLKKYQTKTRQKPYLGTLAEESLVRKQAWLRHGCNAFDSHSPSSQPLSFWTEQDILHYIVDNHLNICSVYGDIIYTDSDGMEYPASDMSVGTLSCSGCQRTGCVFCGFGAHRDKVSRFVTLGETHPKLYDYCMRGGQWVDNPAYDPTAPEYDGEWKNWNPKKIWVPSKEGLGMRTMFDMCNEAMGKEMWKY